MSDPLRFRRLGRGWQPSIDDAASLVGLLELDDTLWVATAAPTSTFSVDPVFLSFLDTDGDGRIRADDVRAAIRWLVAHLLRLDDVRPGNDTIYLSSLVPDLLPAAQLVLGQAGTLTNESITLMEVRAFVNTPQLMTPPELVARITDLERLLLYQAWLLPFVNSFASCRDLYEPGHTPLFGRGSLVLDGRRFTLAVPVGDPLRHEEFTRRGALCVMYVLVGAGEPSWDYEVVVPITDGERGFLYEGMWGTFREGSGRERHACVRRLVLHPISIQDAVLSPFRVLAEAIRVTAGWSGAMRGLVTPVLPATIPVPGVPSPAPAPAVSPTAAGILAVGAASGLALAAISSALTYLSDRFVAASTSVGAWLTTLPLFRPLPSGADTTLGLAAYPIATVLVVLGCLLVPAASYLVPVTIAAWVGLRRRDLGTLLVGSGWAVNTRLHVPADVGRRLTVTPTVPSSQRGV